MATKELLRIVNDEEKAKGLYQSNLVDTHNAIRIDLSNREQGHKEIHREVDKEIYFDYRESKNEYGKTESVIRAHGIEDELENLEKQIDYSIFENGKWLLTKITVTHSTIV